MIKNTASIGIFPNNVIDVTFLYASEIPVIGFPFEVNSASPRTAVIVPNVMINGGRFPTATPTPLISPTPSPARQATINGTISGRFPCPNSAARIPVNAMIDPTDISNPPQMITNIIPNERIPTMDVCFKMFTIFPPDKKLGFNNPSTTTSAMKMITIKYSLMLCCFAIDFCFIVPPSPIFRFLSQMQVIKCFPVRTDLSVIHRKGFLLP